MKGARLLHLSACLIDDSAAEDVPRRGGWGCQDRGAPLHGAPRRRVYDHAHDPMRSSLVRHSDPRNGYSSGAATKPALTGFFSTYRATSNTSSSSLSTRSK